ncbi:MAG TPA: ATP-grasp domain-containing protein [Candidatus Methanoperedens sp.]|nr:ATP-grasp domain-containing protein [Candidatus Methanoperedens sp.]HLB71645.1 ATP-grasp domain-containing protein [Candidatus Methanoperedens sp.]
MSIQTRKYDLKVAITCNLQPENYSHENTDVFAEFDSSATVEAIKMALLNYCREVIVIEGDEAAYGKIKNEKPDFVFNIAEGIKGESREAHIPAMLEMLGIPYSGSGVTTMSITLDKRRTKEVLCSNGIRTPRFQLLKKADEKLNIGFESTLFLKPNCEGSSKGITAKSVVKNEDELRSAAAEIIEHYRQPVLIEQFLSGREFTVAMLGNPPRVLPIVEICFDSLPAGVPKFDCYDVKWVYDSARNDYDTTFCPAQISNELQQQIERTAQRTFEVLEIRDFCRIDMRLDDEGNPSVLDVNALPGLIPDPKENSRFPKAAYTAGYTYEEMIGEIFMAALKRAGMRL